MGIKAKRLSTITGWQDAAPSQGPAATTPVPPRGAGTGRESTAARLHLSQARGWGRCHAGAAGRAAQGSRRALAAYPEKREATGWERC